MPSLQPFSFQHLDHYSTLLVREGCEDFAFPAWYNRVCLDDRSEHPTSRLYSQWVRGHIEHDHLRSPVRNLSQTSSMHSSTASNRIIWV
mmetsp:Transcript_47428/g.74124  ORF Transcript_47428/g.74124 Transcript_47428/m.74124 type:complete len:89 (-) Transcript_47428:398-664(-)